MTNLSRRGLLGAIICAPAIVRASSLMAVKALPVRTVIDNQTGHILSGPMLTDSTAWYLVTDAEPNTYVRMETVMVGSALVTGHFLEGDYPLREQFLRRAHA